MKTITSKDASVYYRGDYWNDIPEVSAYIFKNLTGNEHKWWTADFKERFADRPFKKALFLCCGNGWLEREFIDNQVCKQAIAIDYSPELIAQAQKQKNQRQIKYLQADINQLHFGENKFDLIVNNAALHHVQYINQVSRNLALALKPEGILVNFDYIGPRRNQYVLKHWLHAIWENLKLPASVKQRMRYPHLPTMINTDPSEAVNSHLILRNIKKYFKIFHQKDTNGGLAYLLLTHNPKVKKLETNLRKKLVNKILKKDQELTQKNKVPVLFSYFLAKPNKEILKNQKLLKFYQQQENQREAWAGNHLGVYSYPAYLLIKFNFIFDKLKILKRHFWAIFTILSIFVLGLFVHRSLLFNLKQNLLDWNDYPYYVWTIFQNVNHFKNLDLLNIFNSNAFYPLKNTMLFSDLMWPQSLLALLFSFFSQNPILVFNLIFLATILLNILASFILSTKLFKQKSSVFLATLALSLSVFFFLQSGHLQMISFWPFYLSLAFLFSEKQSFKKLFLVAFLAAVQFYASVYLSLFLLFSIFLFYLSKFKLKYLKNLLIIFFIFFVLVGPVLIKYKLTQKNYQIGIDYGEYITYAAHITDYIFFLPNTYASRLFKTWNKLNMHTGGELIKNPSLILSCLAFVGVLKISFKNKKVILKIVCDSKSLFFLLLIILGFVFSLGPRLNANGFFLTIPLPYWLLLKKIPIFEPIRATNRWYFLFYLGIVYFAILGFAKIKHKIKIKYLFIIPAIIYCLEVLPIHLITENKNFYSDSYLVLEPICQNQKQVLLEFPITPYKKKSHIVELLQYKTLAQLASVRHNCYLINGYSGFTPQELLDFDSKLFVAMLADDLVTFQNLLKSKKINFIKLNKKQLYPELAARVLDWLKQDNFKILKQDQGSVLAKFID